MKHLTTTDRKDLDRFENLYANLTKKGYHVLLMGDYDLFVKLGEFMPSMTVMEKNQLEKAEWKGLKITDTCILFLDYNYKNFTLFQ